MKFSVKRTLKASSLSFMGGYIAPGIYDTQSPNFPAELKDVLIAEVEDPRGLVQCLDPEDHFPEVAPELKSVTSEVLDDTSSGEGEAEADQNPPMGAQDDAEKAGEEAPAPSSPSPTKPKPKPRKISK
jgi:hypothetical protein